MKSINNILSILLIVKIFNSCANVKSLNCFDWSCSGPNCSCSCSSTCCKKKVPMLEDHLELEVKEQEPKSQDVEIKKTDKLTISINTSDNTSNSANARTPLTGRTTNTNTTSSSSAYTTSPDLTQYQDSPEDAEDTMIFIDTPKQVANTYDLTPIIYESKEDDDEFADDENFPTPLELPAFDSFSETKIKRKKKKLSLLSITSAALKPNRKLKSKQGFISRSNQSVLEKIKRENFQKEKKLIKKQEEIEQEIQEKSFKHYRHVNNLTSTQLNVIRNSRVLQKNLGIKVDKVRGPYITDIDLKNKTRTSKKLKIKIESIDNQKLEDDDKFKNDNKKEPEKEEVEIVYEDDVNLETDTAENVNLETDTTEDVNLETDKAENVNLETDTTEDVNLNKDAGIIDDI